MLLFIIIFFFLLHFFFDLCHFVAKAHFGICEKIIVFLLMPITNGRILMLIAVMIAYNALRLTESALVVSSFFKLSQNVRHRFSKLALQVLMPLNVKVLPLQKGSTPLFIIKALISYPFEETAQMKIERLHSGTGDLTGRAFRIDA